MGIGGSIVLINGTPYTWQVVAQNQYQMDHWSFPQSIPAGASTAVYLEFGDATKYHIGDDGGDVRYRLAGTSHEFSIQARVPSDRFNLQVYFDSIFTAFNTQGSTVQLGFRHDSVVPFILSGSSGNFWSNNPPPNWMHALLPVIGARPLRHICMPGSHDAGMSTITHSTTLEISSHVLTQTQNIATQLALGARYLTVRPVFVSDGQYATGVYSNGGMLGASGGSGETFSTIIDELNAFTASNKELVILALSGDLADDDDYYGNYQAFTQNQWNALLKQLQGINHLYTNTSPNVDLSTLTLNDFIGKGEAAVVVVVQQGQSGLTLGDYAGHGFFTHSQFNVTNKYSNTDDLNTMAADQLEKLQEHRPNPDTQPFLLSWTLTPSATDELQLISSVDLANKAVPQIYSELSSHWTAKTYPNILYIDNFAQSAITALAVNINLAVAS